MKNQDRFGEKIRNLRLSKDLSIKQLAEKSQCSVEILEKIEAGQLVPSLTPLLKIARAMGVRLGTFLDDQPQLGPVIVKNGNTEHVVRFSGKSDQNQKSSLDFFSLASDKKDRHMEPFLINVHQSRSKDHPLSSHEGEEFIYVLKGKVEIFYGKDVFQLETGDTIYYDSIVPHDLHATSDSDAKILAVVYAPA